MTNTERIQAHNELLRECIETAENLPDAGGATTDPIIEPLEVTENGTYTAPDGVDGYSPVAVNVPIPDGYIVPNGELEVTENGTHDVTAYASVNVNVSTGGGTDTTIKDFVEGNPLEINNEAVTKIRTRAFNYATNLTAVNFPNAESVNSYAFAECTELISADLPNVTSATTTFLFDGCISLKNVNIPKVASVSNYTFRDCEALEKIEFGNISSCGSYAFSNATSLVTVIIRREGTRVTSLSATNAFNGTPIANGTGYVYVPSSLVDAFKAASNWSTYASQIRAIEDYPEITGG